MASGGRRIPERVFVYDIAVQLRLDAADRLVELVEERRGPVHADVLCRAVFGTNPSLSTLRHARSNSGVGVAAAVAPEAAPAVAALV